MELNQVFQDKDKWKKETINLLLRDLKLLSLDDNAIQNWQIGSTILICVYGKSQVGKTTLILNMIGLKDEASKKEVDGVLRGGVSLGNSSTSTAIIYSQSETDQYGVAIKTIDGQEITPVTYCSANEMCLELQSIRSKVEKNVFHKTGILHIFIPKKYFLQSVSLNKVSIIDLPGVESRNLHEKEHVESLMNLYIPISSGCIIVCPANVIQSLETEELPKYKDWKNYTNKFFLVLTKAYSCGSIKDFFKTQPMSRKVGFKEMMFDTYQKEVRKVLGTTNKTEIFPLELGQSFESLVENELKNENDRKEIIQTRDSILSALHECIIKHRGEQLISIIKDLHSIVGESEKKINLKLEENQKIQNDRIISFKEKINGYTEKLNDLKEECKNIEENRIHLIELDRTLNDDLDNDLTTLLTPLNEQLESKAYSLSKEKDGEYFFNDENKKFYLELKRSLINHLKEYLKQVDEKMDMRELKIDISQTCLASSILSQSDIFVNEIYPPTPGLFGRIFSKGIPIHKVLDCLSRINAITKSEIKQSVIDLYSEKINKKLEDLNLEINARNSVIRLFSENKLKIEKNIEQCQTEISNNKKELEFVKKQKNADKETLNKYLNFAKSAYLHQRNEIVEKINFSKTPEEKTILVLLLGVIEREYNNITNVSDE